MKSSLKAILTQKIINLQKGVRRLQIIVFSWPYAAYHQSDSLGLLQGNSHLSPLRPKRWPIWKLEDTDRQLQIIVFSESFGAYNKSYILEILP